MLTFVLIPGAGADPRVYEATIAALRDLGHDGIAPPLPLDDPEAGPSAHADAVVAALGDPPPAPLVVVGQSLGAYTAAIVADRLSPRRLILLAPMIPRPGETAGDWWEGTGHAEAIAPLTRRIGTPENWDEAALDEVFYHDVDAATLAANDEYDGRPAPGMFTEPLTVSRWPYEPTRCWPPATIASSRSSSSAASPASGSARGASSPRWTAATCRSSPAPATWPPAWSSCPSAWRDADRRDAELRPALASPHKLSRRAVRVPSFPPPRRSAPPRSARHHRARRGMRRRLELLR